MLHQCYFEHILLGGYILITQIMSISTGFTTMGVNQEALRPPQYFKSLLCLLQYLRYTNFKKCEKEASNL